jgi:uncharacterized protein with von Willebrand factor type A (vWA) domain
MTPEQFITELFGDGWESSQLPAFLAMAERMSDDAQRYHVVRDYMKQTDFRVEPRSREEYHEFDDVIDAKRFELLAVAEEVERGTP